MNFIPVRISTIRGNSTLLFDVFLNLEERYVKYKKANETFEYDRLERFFSKGIKKVFIDQSQEPNYLKYLEAGLEALSNADVKKEDRAVIAHGTLNSEAEHIEKNLDNEASYKATTDRIEKVIDFVTTNPETLKTMLGQAGISVDNSQHSATLASMSIAVASKLGVTDQNELMSMSLAALLHDIGKEKLGFEPSITIGKVAKEDLAKFKKHGEAAVESLAGKRYITPRVLRIIQDHEEIGDGQGYPEKKKVGKLPLSSQAFNMCNLFDHFSMENQLEINGDAFKKFNNKYPFYFDGKLIAALGELIR